MRMDRSDWNNSINPLDDMIHGPSAMDLINKAKTRESLTQPLPPIGDPVISVPIAKDVNYSAYLFNAIASATQVFANQHGTFPDVLKFSGKLGAEIINEIDNNKWDFSKFTITRDDGCPINTLVIKCSTELTKTTDVNIGSNSIDGMIIEGIPSQRTTASIIASQIGFGYKKDQTIDPDVTLSLIR